jgi:hypothetical protein
MFVELAAIENINYKIISLYKKEGYIFKHAHRLTFRMRYDSDVELIRYKSTG